MQHFDGAALSHITYVSGGVINEQLVATYRRLVIKGKLHQALQYLMDQYQVKSSNQRRKTIIQVTW